MPTNKFKNLSTMDKRALLQGAMISAIAAVHIKIPHQIRRQKVEGIEKPNMLTPEWFLNEILRLMRDVWRLDIVEGTREYTLVQAIAEVNCNTHNAQQSLMQTMAMEGPIDIAKMRAIYGI